jgi:hopanoid-associated phosphorylase
VRRLGIVAGIRRELRCLGGPLPAHWVAAAVGGSTARAYETAKSWADRGEVAALMSFGIAGGLDPALKPGDLVVATGALGAGGRRYPVDAGWSDALTARLPGCRRGLVHGVDAEAATLDAKRTLFARSGALVCDMESEGVAHAALDAGLPFAVLRAVADPADRALPPIVLDLLTAEGKPRLGALIGRLLRAPGHLPALLQIGRDARAAEAALLFAVDRLGDALAPP